MPSCVRNSSVYWEPARKSHSWCHCSESWGSSPGGWWWGLSQTGCGRCWKDVTKELNVTVTKLPLLVFAANLSSEMKVFLSSAEPRVFPRSSGPPSHGLPVSFSCLFFSAGERSGPALRFRVLSQTAPSSGSGKALAEKKLTESRKDGEKRQTSGIAFIVMIKEEKVEK